MFIITAMTSDTLGVLLIRMEFSRMTDIALHIPVLPGKRIFRVMIMVKPRTVPTRFRMTVLAFLPVAAGMHIIQAVT